MLEPADGNEGSAPVPAPTVVYVPVPSPLSLITTGTVMLFVPSLMLIGDVGGVPVEKSYNKWE